MDDLTYYDELAERAERGQLQAIPGTILQGAPAAAAGRAALLDATGAGTIDDAIELALGRPPLGQGKPSTTTWRIRTTESLDSRARALAEHEGVNVSVLVRKAVAEYVDAHSK